MNSWIVKNRIMRRLIVFSMLIFFMYITIGLFSGDIGKFQFFSWSVLAGLVREILKFYLKGTSQEADSD